MTKMYAPFYTRIGTLLLTFSTLIADCFAEPFQPTQSDQVIARWPAVAIRQHELSSEDRLAQAQQLLQTANQPGQSFRYGLAEALVAPVVNNLAEKKAITTAGWYIWATIRQQQHEFDTALEALQEITSPAPEYESAQLMRARIFLTQGNTRAAQKSCLSLVGITDLLTLSACTLEATPDNLAANYQHLSGLIDSHGLPAEPKRSWIMQLMAQMAMQLNRPEQAVQWLGAPTTTASVSWLSQWADLHFALQDPATVYRHLDQLAQMLAAQQLSLEDGLLLRLAHAGQLLNKLSWQSLVEARMALRETRSDLQHASDLAYYFIYLAPNPNKALHWAGVNLQSANEAADQQLMQRALALGLPPARRSE
ncbi:hypothetical protein [Simiduia aestuariiviva]|uniref:Tetratricopeptide repeat protein n=1 Tax=Simiduia aestuariiviva TaxID=1510459 RepID=A0A839URA3_9GAMM|nr:hypothetical protein [Simiduia aestuariiviva]MBB3169030.1 hypothetical protein [Simiduia aestuariiviva]